MAGRNAPKLDTFDWSRDGTRESETTVRPCARSGCAEAGTHRAPKSRDDLNSYQWLCLEHAREFNRSWNYYKGMSDDEVEADLRRDTTWDRPTWRLGSNGAVRPERFADPFNILGGDAFAEQATPCGPPPISHEEQRAYRTLGLDYPVSNDDLRARYKTLVKAYHPDANAGDCAAEDRLKDINAAYRVLRETLNP